MCFQGLGRMDRTGRQPNFVRLAADWQPNLAAGFGHVKSALNSHLIIAYTALYNISNRLGRRKRHLHFSAIDPPSVSAQG